MPESSDLHCIHCHAGEHERRLERCPICFKGYCDRHAHDMSGRSFCSAKCAEYFFFEDPDESEEPREE